MSKQPKPTRYHLRVTDREFAAILAGLRFLQGGPPLPEAVDLVATDGGRFERLDEEELDALCERLNTT